MPLLPIRSIRATTMASPGNLEQIRRRWGRLTPSRTGSLPVNYWVGQVRSRRASAGATTGRLSRQMGAPALAMVSRAPPGMTSACQSVVPSIRSATCDARLQTPLLSAKAGLSCLSLRYHSHVRSSCHLSFDRYGTTVQQVCRVRAGAPALRSCSSDSPSRFCRKKKGLWFLLLCASRRHTV